MGAIILYNSRTGATEKYAKWLAEKLSAPLKQFEEIGDDEFKKIDKLYILSGTYGGQMPMMDFLQSKWDILAGKDITAIAVGMVAEKHWWTRLSYRRVPKKIRDAIKFHKVIGWTANKESTKEAVKKENLEGII